MGWFENFNAERADRVLSVIAKIMNIAFLVSLSAGILITVIYSGLTNHSLEGATLGDGLLFIMVASWFFTLYTLIVMIMLGAGVIAGWHVLFFNRAERVSLRVYAPYADRFYSYICVISVAVVLVLLFLSSKYVAAGTLFLAFVVLAMLYRVLFRFNLQACEADVSEEDLRRNRRNRVRLIIIIYATPFLLGQFKGDLIKTSMTLAGIRVGEASVMFKDEYKEFLIASGIKEEPLYQVIVVARGLGSSSTIEICGQRFSVPNEQFFYSKGATENLKLNSACTDEEP